MFRKLDVLAKNPAKEQNRDKDDADVQKPIAQIQTHAIRQVIQRLDQKCADSSIPDFGGDLPFILGRRDEVIEEYRKHEIENHGRILVAVDRRIFGMEDGLPEEHGADQRHDPKHRAQQKIPPIDKGILDADAEKLPVLERARRKGVRAGCSGFWIHVLVNRKERKEHKEL